VKTETPLRILSIEDDPRDSELVGNLIEAEGLACEVTRVETEAAMRASLDQGGIDLILADHSLPSFDGLSALKLAVRDYPDVPFIFVSGTLGEELAIEALKIGATDYVLKTRLSRLVPSIRRALRETRERAERKEADEKLKRNEAYLAEAQQLSRTGSFGWEVSSGKIHWSQETFRIMGFEPTSTPTIERILDRTHPDDREMVMQLIERASREGTDFDLEHRLLMPDGTVKYVRVVGRPRADEFGRLEFVGAATDITERKSAEKALRRSENYLAEAQNLTHTGSCSIDGRTRETTYWSEEMFRLFGFDSQKGLPTWEQWLQRVHPEDRDKVKSAGDRTFLERVDCDVEFRLVKPDGTVKHIHGLGHPLLSDNGELVQVVGTMVDITGRKSAEEALRRSENYLAEAQKLTQSGSWAWNVRTRDVFWSQEMFRIFDYEPGSVKPTMDLFLERVHPEDRARVEERAKAESTNKNMGDSEGDYRIILNDGTIKHLHSIAHSVLDEFGEITEVIGTTMDVTEQHRARTALETAFEQIKVLKDQLHNENVALREEIDRSSMFEEIVGESAAVQAVLARVTKVAPADSTVLVTGETGTGKELIARAIHKRSPRSTRAFVSVNCAAIPPSLIASELFGHEKGAFTGAMQRRLGKFELAEGGTIFLDEIGELPAETQIALLRVLQEREFERVGGSKVIRTNVRVIAATNRNLQSCIEAGTFRSDLYYRLNVFPIEVPPLRKRKEDIALLVQYFIDRYASKAGKRITGISRAALELLKCYAWPGNIRELQNIVERSVIVCDSETLTVDANWLCPPNETSLLPSPTPLRMTDADERKAIEDALSETHGRVSGPSGAAARLGVPPSTLDSKIKVYKIDKHRFKSSKRG